MFHYSRVPFVAFGSQLTRAPEGRPSDTRHAGVRSFPDTAGRAQGADGYFQMSVITDSWRSGR